MPPERCAAADSVSVRGLSSRSAARVFVPPLLLGTRRTLTYYHSEDDDEDNRDDDDGGGDDCDVGVSLDIGKHRGGGVVVGARKYHHRPDPNDFLTHNKNNNNTISLHRSIHLVLPRNCITALQQQVRTEIFWQKKKKMFTIFNFFFKQIFVLTRYPEAEYYPNEKKKNRS